ncbi:MAG: flagellar biosynthetic protein FliR [Pseudomonadota bacterium]
MDAALTAIFTEAGALVFVAAGVFARIGAAAFLVPGLGERSIPVRVRLGAALAIAVLLAPIIRGFEPFTPATGIDLLRVIVAEALIGLIIGLAFRFMVYALQITGMVAAQHLSVAQMFGAGVAPEPEPTISTLLAMGGITLAMAAGLHVHLVASLVMLYDVFPFGEFPNGSDMAEWAISRSSETFALGLALAAPFVVVGFAYNLALGALNRAMPQLLVALVGVPALVWMGLVLLSFLIPTLMDTWLGHLDGVMLDPLGMRR